MTITRAPLRKWRVAGLLVVLAVALAAVVRELPRASTSAPRSTAPHAPALSAEATPPPDEARPSGGRETLGEADGAIPDGTTVFDGDVPGVAQLDPALLAAVRRAATDAGIAFLVDSGWRTRAYQQHLLDEAVARYGSAAEAARWVATPDRSAHVSGDAIDIGPPAAASWLSQHGAAYGLCQIYGNEPWHYELRPTAASDGCPPLYADAAHDPRLQR
jgi:hypothetical protein